MLQFSPTGAHSTEELVYAGCIYSNAKKHWSLSASDLNRDTKTHHRAIKEPPLPNAKFKTVQATLTPPQADTPQTAPGVIAAAPAAKCPGAADPAR